MMKNAWNVTQGNNHQFRPLLPGIGTLVLFLALLMVGPALADELCPEGDPPRITVDPSPIHISGLGPWTEDLMITIDLYADIPSYNTLEVYFDNTLAYSGTKATGSNTICNNKTGGAGACAQGATDQQVIISYTAAFDVIGSYSIEVHADKGGTSEDICETVYFVTMEFVTVEFKAPPAIANEYIKNDIFYAGQNGKRRGCVISKIAQNHAKNSEYGPKGGDGEMFPGLGYDIDKIHADVRDYFANECNK